MRARRASACCLARRRPQCHRRSSRSRTPKECCKQPERRWRLTAKRSRAMKRPCQLPARRSRSTARAIAPRKAHPAAPRRRRKPPGGGSGAVCERRAGCLDSPQQSVTGAAVKVNGDRAPVSSAEKSLASARVQFVHGEVSGRALRSELHVYEAAVGGSGHRAWADPLWDQRQSGGAAVWLGAADAGVHRGDVSGIGCGRAELEPRRARLRAGPHGRHVSAPRPARRYVRFSPRMG